MKNGLCPTLKKCWLRNCPCGKKEAKDTKNILKMIGSLFIPGKVILFKDPEREGDRLSEIAPFTKK